MSDRRWYVETSPDGRTQFVSLRRSRSHHHYGRHHHHHYEKPPAHRCCRDDCCHLGRDEWNDLVEREHKLRETNERLVHENHTLKCNFEAAEAEARRLGGIVPLLQTEVQALRDENAALRRTIENAGGNAGKYHREVERLRLKLHKMERERDGLLAKIKELSRHHHLHVPDRIEELKRIIIAWERKFDVVEDHNKRLRRDVEDQRRIIQQQDERIHAYERILRRHGFLRCD